MALADAMAADPTVVMLGEDVAEAGGPFGVTRGLARPLRRRARARHADLGGGDRRRRGRRRDERLEAGASRSCSWIS